LIFVQAKYLILGITCFNFNCGKPKKNHWNNG
jgi:hypothetical protein